MILQRNGVSYCSTRSERRRRQPFSRAEAEAFRDPRLGADAWRSARPRAVGPTPPSRSSDADGECASEKDNNEEPEGEEKHPGHGVPPPLSRFRSVKETGPAHHLAGPTPRKPYLLRPARSMGRRSPFGLSRRPPCMAHTTSSAGPSAKPNCRAPGQHVAPPEGSAPGARRRQAIVRSSTVAR